MVSGVSNGLSDGRAVGSMLAVRFVVAPSAGSTAAASSTATRGPATVGSSTVGVGNDFLVSVSVSTAAARRPATGRSTAAAAAAQLGEDTAQERSTGDSDRDDGQKQSLLGDDGNSEQGQDSKSGQLNLQQTQEREEFLEDLLLLSALLDDQTTNGFLDFIGNGVGQGSAGTDKVPAQRALLEEVLGTVEEEVLEGRFAAFNGVGGFDFVGGVVQSLSSAVSGLGEGKSSEEVDVLLFKESLGTSEDLNKREKMLLDHLVL